MKIVFISKIKLAGKNLFTEREIDIQQKTGI
jgi:hypothetical protein